MTKKSKSKNEVKKKAAPKSERATFNDALSNAAFDAAMASFRAATPSMADRRKELLARVAGTIAAGLVTSPSPSIATPSTMAMAAVDIAEEILKKAGIPSVEPSAESASSTDNVGVGAAS